MKKRLAILAMVLAVAISVGTQGASAPPVLLPRRPVSFAQSFRLLLVRNIFDASRTTDRGTYRSSTTTTTFQPQSTLTLTGLVYEAGAYSAFVEDSRSNVTTKYRIGDRVGSGQITAAGMDYIDLNVRGRMLHIYLGQTLSGSNPGATTNPTTEPSPGNDILERLRQRRLEEMR